MKFIESIFDFALIYFSFFATAYMATGLQDYFKFSTETLLLTFIILYLENARKRNRDENR
jgi:hypothetical protein